MDNSEGQLQVEIAIQNNVALCQCVADAHSIPTMLENGVWMAPYQMPPYYPNLITTESNTDVKGYINYLRHRLDPGWGLKDSYARLQLGSNNFRLAISGYWFGASAYAIPKKAPSQTGQATVVQCERDFQRWIVAWDSVMGRSIFPSELWQDENLQFVLAENEEQIVGGLLLNKSSNGIGMSNWFGDLNAVIWAIAETLNLDNWIVGYTDSEECIQLSSFGFEKWQSINVWIYE